MEIFSSVRRVMGAVLLITYGVAVLYGQQSPHVAEVPGPLLRSLILVPLGIAATLSQLMLAFKLLWEGKQYRQASLTLLVIIVGVHALRLFEHGSIALQDAMRATLVYYVPGMIALLDLLLPNGKQKEKPAPPETGDASPMY